MYVMVMMLALQWPKGDMSVLAILMEHLITILGAFGGYTPADLV